LFAALWLLTGGLTIPLLWAVWRSNPSDDVDYEPMARLFFMALFVWMVIGVVLLVAWLLYRAARKQASLAASGADALAR
jgi:cbb3-type cytochrome oxidase subunit 3